MLLHLSCDPFDAMNASKCFFRYWKKKKKNAFFLTAAWSGSQLWSVIGFIHYEHISQNGIWREKESLLSKMLDRIYLHNIHLTRCDIFICSYSENKAVCDSSHQFLNLFFLREKRHRSSLFITISYVRNHVKILIFDCNDHTLYVQ